MISAVVNTVAVLLGGGLGLCLKQGLPQRFSRLLMQGVGLCVLYIGISGALKGSNQLVLILSMVLGILIGEGVDLDDKLNRLAAFIERRAGRKSSSEGNIGREKGGITQGFVAASLLFCVGSMSIIGSIQSGLTGNHEMIYAKSIMDFISAIIFASSLGVGVLLSAASVLVFQGGIVLLAHWLAPMLTDYVIGEMICAGSVVIIALGLNLILDSKIKVTNIMPATFLPILLCQFMK